MTGTISPEARPSLLLRLFMGAICVPLVLLVRLLRPLVLIRFGNFRNYTLGMFAVHAETYLCDRQLNIVRSKVIDVFCHVQPPANRRLDRIVERNFLVTPAAKYLYAVNSRLPGAQAHICELGNPESDRKRDHVRAFQTGPHLRLNEDEIEEARTLLYERCGIRPQDKFICFSARDHGYLKTMRSDYKPDAADFRNSSIEDYLMAAEKLAELGFYVLRMGAIVEKPIHSSNEKVIDYASLYRDELLDLYLGFNCEMFITDNSGIYAIPAVGRRPVAFSNAIPISNLMTWQGLFIPKLLYLRDEQRFMTFPEFSESGAAVWDALYNRTFTNAAQTEIVDNSPDEISDLALEALGRIKGAWKDQKEDDKMQKAFWHSLRNIDFNFGGPIRLRIATSFLRRHEDLLA